MKKNEYQIWMTDKDEYDVYQKRSFLVWWRWEYVITLESMEEVSDYMLHTIPSGSIVELKYFKKKK